MSSSSLFRSSKIAGAPGLAGLSFSARSAGGIGGQSPVLCAWARNARQNARTKKVVADVKRTVLAAPDSCRQRKETREKRVTFLWHGRNFPPLLTLWNAGEEPQVARL